MNDNQNEAPKVETTFEKIPDKKQSPKDFIKETVYIIVLSLIIVLPIRAYIAQPYIVDGASMNNTFQNGNYLIVNEISYKFNPPQRGQVIVLKAPPAALALQKEATTSNVDYIKRIIGLPGETVEINGDQVTIVNAANPNGEVLNEPYIYIDNSLGDSPFSNLKETITLKAGQYFVMGDNRHNSSDSRLWGILPQANIIGDVAFRLFPFNEIAKDPGQNVSYQSSATSSIK